MNSLNPIHLDNGSIQIHPFRKQDMMRQNKIVEDLFEIKGDPESLPYSPEKIVEDKETLSQRMMGIVIGYQEKMRYTHFLTFKDKNKVIGEIDIISPKTVEKNYNIKNTWLIEYYLNKHFWNKGIMTGAIKAIVKEMINQHKKNIAAIVNRNNSSSIRVLEKAGFEQIKKFDRKQDFYKLQ